MSQDTLQRIVEDVKTLTAQEREQLRALLDERLTSEHNTTEAQEKMFLQHLLDKRIISHIPTRSPEDEAYLRHSPIVVHGEPVSETVIKERR